MALNCEGTFPAFLVEKLQDTHHVVLYKYSKNCLNFSFSVNSFNFYKANKTCCNALPSVKQSGINTWLINTLIKRAFKIVFSYKEVFSCAIPMYAPGNPWNNRHYYKESM